MATSRILLVEDDITIRNTLAAVLRQHDFTVSVANDVSEALRKISSESYDLLLSDLHMPGPGDGLTVISAMRHANPKAGTVLLSAFPDLQAAAQAIIEQADEILVKPVDVPRLVETIRKRVCGGPANHRAIETIAAILQRTTECTIQRWFDHVQLEEKLTIVPMSFDLRCGHLPKVFEYLNLRLLALRPLGNKELKSIAAASHGLMRRKQGYSAAMMVEESRLLQTSIFETLQDNVATIDFHYVLLSIMMIADEIDSQLSQSMDSYIAESTVDQLVN